MRKTPVALSLAAGLALLAGCSTLPGSDGPAAVAQLQPKSGSNVTGTVRFAQAGDRVKVTGEVRGLRPGGEHGFHVHERGDCSSPDGNSAGGHFNPTGQPHGNPMGAAHHAGDMPSLRADATGVARFAFESTTMRVGSGPTDVVGRGLIVHQNPDDYTTQPTGNAGGRLACAVITRAGSAATGRY